MNTEYISTHLLSMATGDFPTQRRSFISEPPHKWRKSGPIFHFANQEIAKTSIGSPGAWRACPSWEGLAGLAGWQVNWLTRNNQRR